MEEQTIKKSSHSSRQKQIENDEIDLIKLINLLWRKKYLIIFLSLFTCLLGVFYLKITDKIYQADGLMKIESKRSGMSMLLSNDIAGASAFASGSGIENLISSRLVLAKTIEQLHLQTQIEEAVKKNIKNVYSKPQGIDDHLIDANFRVPKSYWSLKEKPKFRVKFLSNKYYQLFKDSDLLINGEFGFEFAKDGYQIAIDSSVDLEGKIYNIIPISKNDAIEELRDNISISEQGKQSELYEVTFSGKNKIKNEIILNSLMNNFMQETVRINSQEASKSIAFLESQVPILDEKLQLAEQALNIFMQENSAVDMSLDAEKKINTLAQIETQLSTLDLKEKELRQQYTTRHPQMLALSNQKDSLLLLKKDIISELNKAPETQQGIIRLRRDVEVNQGIYLQLLNKLQELKVVEASKLGNVLIIDFAQSSDDAIKPKAAIIIIISTMLGAIIAIVIVFFNQMLRKPIVNLDDIINEVGLSVIGTIPKSKKQQVITKKARRRRRMRWRKKANIAANSILANVAHDDLSVEAIRSLQTALNFSLKETSNNSIMLTGPTENVGKTFVSTNLAVVLAESGLNVAIVDLDFRKSYLNGVFELEDEKINIDEWFNGDTESVSSLIHKTSIENLYFIPCGKKKTHISNILMSNKFALLFSKLREEFDLLIIDTPPVLAVADAVMIAQHAGKVFLVVRHNESSTRELELAVNKLAQSNVEVESVIINDYDQKIAGYYYNKYYM